MLLASKQMLILYKYAETLRYQILILPLVSEGDEQLQFWGIAKFFEGYFGAKVQENLIVCTIFQNWVTSVVIPMCAIALSFEDAIMMFSRKCQLNLLKLFILLFQNHGSM